jgi:hypothetical protein
MVVAIIVDDAVRVRPDLAHEIYDMISGSKLS